MSIHALPDTTVRVLGASQVLSEPERVVKELVDNALDANATSIGVEIHFNTLDIIQVRDNGHGIAPEDRPLVARRYCTSKLASYDDVNSIGGSSLGFRGEALASAAELSGSVTISTRVEGEQVGAALKINQKGEVTGQDRASLPVGTVVRITDFINSNPVRRKVTLKNADNCLKKIKRTLQAYAFARPNVRFSLRVLKAKNNKGDWVYAPKLNGTAEDAAIKLVGSACTTQCMWSILEHEGFTFQAFLPRPDAEPSKVAGFGPFISVDSRPVSSTKAHLKQIGKAFREALKKVSSQFEDVKEPFLYLEISCPRDAYDINIEPAKDDIVFEEASKVMDGAKKLFATVYIPSVAPVEDQAPMSARESRSEVLHDGLDDFTTSLEPGHVAEGPDAMVAAASDLNAQETGHDILHPVPPQEQEEEIQEPSRPQRAFRSNMYGCDEEDLDMLEIRPSTGRTEADFEELRQAKNDVTLSNPWVLAKLNSTVRRPPVEQAREPNSEPASTSANMVSSPTKRTGEWLEMGQTALPTPRPSSPSPPHEEFHPSNHVPDMRLARDGRVIGSSSLPPPQMYTPMPSSDMRHPVEDLPAIQHATQPQYNYGLTSSFDEPAMGTRLEDIPHAGTQTRRSPKKQPQQSRINKPFQPPLKNQPPREKVWFDHLEHLDSNSNRRPQRQSEGNGLVTRGELGDFVEDARPLTPPRRNRDIRDFVARGGDPISALIEARNYGSGASARNTEEQENHASDLEYPRNDGPPGGRGFVRASEIATLNAEDSSPEKPARRAVKRRKTSERQALQDLSTNAPLSREHPEDANADADAEYRPTTGNRPASRRRSSHKVGRTKSSKLPLERTPAGQGMHGLVFKTAVSIDQLAESAGKMDEERSLLGYNQPAVNPQDVFTADPPNMEELTNSLHELLIKAGADTDASSPSSLFNELQNAFARRATNTEGDEVMSTI